MTARAKAGRRGPAAVAVEERRGRCRPVNVCSLAPPGRTGRGYLESGSEGFGATCRASTRIEHRADGSGPRRRTAPASGPHCPRRRFVTLRGALGHKVAAENPIQPSAQAGDLGRPAATAGQPYRSSTGDRRAGWTVSATPAGGEVPRCLAVGNSGLGGILPQQGARHQAHFTRGGNDRASAGSAFRPVGFSSSGTFQP